MKKTILVSADKGETRVAVLEAKTKIVFFIYFSSVQFQKGQKYSLLFWLSRACM